MFLKRLNIGVLFIQAQSDKGRRILYNRNYVVTQWKSAQSMRMHP